MGRLICPTWTLHTLIGFDVDAFHFPSQWSLKSPNTTPTLVRQIEIRASDAADGHSLTMTRDQLPEAALQIGAWRGRDWTPA